MLRRIARHSFSLIACALLVAQQSHADYGDAPNGSLTPSKKENRLLPKTTLDIDEFGICRTLNNTNGTLGGASNQYFIPTGSLHDWQQAIANLPPGVTADACLPVNCAGSYSDCDPCTVRCGGGTQTCRYVITQPAKRGGTPCPVSPGTVQASSCNTHSCYYCEVYTHPHDIYQCSGDVTGTWHTSYRSIFGCSCGTFGPPNAFGVRVCNDCGLGSASNRICPAVNNTFNAGTCYMTYTEPNW